LAELLDSPDQPCHKAATYTEETRTDIHALGLIRTDDPSVWAAEDRSRGHWSTFWQKKSTNSNEPEEQGHPSYELRFAYRIESGVDVSAGTLPRKPDHRLYRIEHAVVTG
jgi:hypothetical protein